MATGSGQKDTTAGVWALADYWGEDAGPHAGMGSLPIGQRLIEPNEA